MIRKRLHEIEDEQLSKIPKLNDSPRRLQREFVDNVLEDAKKRIIDAKNELDRIGNDVNDAERRFYPPEVGDPPEQSLREYFVCFVTRLKAVSDIAVGRHAKQTRKLDKIEKELEEEEKSLREAAYAFLTTLRDLKYDADQISLLPHKVTSPEVFIGGLWDEITPLQKKLKKTESKLNKYWDVWNDYTETLVWKHFEEAQDSLKNKVRFAERYLEHVNREASDKERYRKKGKQRGTSVGGEPRYPSAPRNTQSLVSSRASTPASVGDPPPTRKPSPVESPPPFMPFRATSATRSSSSSRQSSSSDSRQPPSSNSRKKFPSNSRQPSSTNSRKKSPSNSRKQSPERKKKG